jgi:hypothetical protein
MTFEITSLDGYRNCDRLDKLKELEDGIVFASGVCFTSLFQSDLASGAP